MATYHVTFVNHLNESGETFEFPTDYLNSNGAIILDFSYVESDINPGEDFAREIWEYEIDDDDQDRFETGLGQSEPVLEYKIVEPVPDGQ